jgi:26S proteasome regulatory subunit N3
VVVFQIQKQAIRDGVIEATIDHEQSFMQSKENLDIYSTKEPQEAFHQRVQFCLELYNTSIRAMRYPPKAYRKDFESVEERREREQQDLERAKEIAEEEDDEFP